MASSVLPKVPQEITTINRDTRITEELEIGSVGIIGMNFAGLGLR